MVARCSSPGIIHRARPVLLVAAVSPLVAATIALWPRDSRSHVDACGAITHTPRQIGVQAAGQATICLLNRERTGRGLPALQENTLLDSASLEHSTDMVQRRYFEHTAPDGRSVGDRLR